MITNQPASGDVVVYHVFDITALTLNSVSDGTTSFTQPTGTGFTGHGCNNTNDATAGTDCVGYLIEPNGTGGKTFTATFSGTCTDCSISVVKFHLVGGTAVFDTAISGTGTNAQVNTPVINGTGTVELFWVGCSNAHHCQPSLSPWIADPHGAGVFGEEAEFQINLGGTQTTEFNGTNGGGIWTTTAFAIKLTGVSTVTVNAATCSNTDVQTAVNGSTVVQGSTVNIPAGSCTWTGDVNLPIPITLAGAGIGSTIITHGVTGTQNHLISLFCPQSSGEFRITGIQFNGLGFNHRAIIATTFGNYSGYTNSPYRIDHSQFNGTNDGGGGAAGLIDNFSCAGLIDHSDFPTPDNAEDIHNNGDGNFGINGSGWTDNVVVGGAAMLFIEDNTCEISDPGGNFQGNSCSTNFNGSRVVFRHNTLTGSEIDFHGTAGFIGTRWYEAYSNAWVIANGTTQDKYIDARAGSGLIYNNTSSGQSTSANMTFREEDTNTWPQAYQVGSGINGGTDAHNSCSTGTVNSSPVFAWNNTGNNLPNYNISSPNVQANRDVFTSSSQPTLTPVEELSTDTCSTTLTYTPYQYPHPLQNAGGAGSAYQSLLDLTF